MQPPRVYPNSSRRAAAAFAGSGIFGSSRLIVTFIGARSSNPIAQEGATNAWWHEVIVPRRGEDDLRGVRKEPPAFQIDTLVQGKDQRGSQTKEANRSIEHDERQRHVENRDPEQQEIDRAEKQGGIGAEQQQDVSQIEW